MSNPYSNNEHKDRKYLPIDRELHFILRMTGAKTSTSARAQIRDVVETLDRHKDRLYYEYSSYIDKLFPESAYKALTLSRTSLWPGHPIDKVLGTLLKDWMKTKIANPEQYVRKLCEIIKEEGCTEGVFTRLNRSLVNRHPNRIVVKTRYGSTTVKDDNPFFSMDNELATKIKEFLMAQGKYQPSHRIVDPKLSVEQELISWIGYIILVAALKSEGTSVVVENDLLKLEDKKVPDPNPQSQAALQDRRQPGQQ